MQTILLRLDTIINNYASIDLMQGYNYTLEAHITDNYKDMDLTGVTVQLQMQKPDKKFIIQTENIVIEGNKIKATLDKDFTREDGQAKLQVVLFKDKFTFGSWVVKAKIKPSAINDNDGQSDNKVTITEALVNKISEAENTKIELDKSIANGDVTAIKGNVDKIKDVEIPKINEQLEHIENQTDIKLNKKRDKDILIEIGDLSQEVKESLTGGNVAIVGENSVNYTNLANDLALNLGEFKELSLVQTNGYYHSQTGTFSTSSDYITKEVSCVYGEKYSVTALVSGSATALVMFFDTNNSKIGILEQGVSGTDKQYDNFVFNIPKNCVKVAVCGKASGNLTLNKSVVININDIKKLQLYNEKTFDVQKGFYHVNTGVYTEFVSYKSVKMSCIPNDKFKVTTTTSGSATALALFFKKDGSYTLTVNSYLEQAVSGTDKTYNDFIVTIPSGYYYVAFCCKDGNVFTIKKLETNNINDVVVKNINEIESIKNDIEILSNDQINYWNGKKAVWFGTSIPAGNGNNSYPYMISQMLGMNIYNEAVGSSPARAGCHSLISSGDSLGWTGCAWQNICYSLSQTIAEKNELINNWDTWKTKLTNTPPDTLSDSEKTKILNCSYENKLKKYLSGGSVGQVDLYIFDHGHNDNLKWDLEKDELTTIPSNAKDRTYFIGSMNFLIDLILTDNPKARILFISHYENDRKPQIVEAQKVLQDYWDFPMIELYNKLGFSQKVINGKTMTQWYMPDDLHPHSDTTGETNKLISEVISEEMKLVR